MPLKPQDLVVALKLAALGGEPWNYQRLALELALSQSETHAAVRRAAAAGLLETVSGEPVQPNPRALAEFLLHGAKYAFPALHGPPAIGMPTGRAAPPLSARIRQRGELPPVWPWPEGGVRGYALMPLYRSVPLAAARDRKLYELLALLDAVREGRSDEARLAARELATRIGRGAKTPARAKRGDASALPIARAAPVLHSPRASYQVRHTDRAPHTAAARRRKKPAE